MKIPILLLPNSELIDSLPVDAVTSRVTSFMEKGVNDA